MPDLSDHLRALDRAESPDLWAEIRSRRPGPPIKPPGSLFRHVALLAVVVLVSAGAGVGIWAGLKTSATTGPSAATADLVPVNMRYLTATFDRSGAQHSGAQQMTVTTDPSVIEQLRQAIDRLPTAPVVQISCTAPPPGGTVTLAFSLSATKKPSVVARADKYCPSTVMITVDGRQGRTLSGGPSILALASRLLLAKSSPKETPRCLPAQLHLSSDHSGWHANLAGMGQFVETFTVTNVSSTDCSLGGWPSLQAVVAGKAETVKTVRVRQGGPRAKIWSMLSLQPGRTASFDIYGADWNAIKNRSCPATTSGFLITLPGEPTAVSVTAPEPDCGSFYVAPLIAGSSDHQAWSSVVAG